MIAQFRIWVFYAKDKCVEAVNIYYTSYIKDVKICKQIFSKQVIMLNLLLTGSTSHSSKTRET